MPRYYFELWDEQVRSDDEGSEMASVEEARLHGILFAAEYLRDHPELLGRSREVRVTVRDEQARIVQTVVTLAANGG